MSVVIVDEPAGPGSVDDLWQRYRTGHESVDADRLLLTYAPLVKYVVGRLNLTLPEGVWQSDLLEAGLAGLAGLIPLYRPDEDGPFTGWVVPRIRTSILTVLRSPDVVAAMRQDKVTRLHAAMVQFQEQAGRPPLPAELAAASGYPVEKVTELLTRLAGEHGAAVSDPWTIPVDVDFDADAALGWLAGALRAVTVNERLIIGLYYYEELTIAEVAQVLGCRVEIAEQSLLATLERLNVGTVSASRG